MMMKLFRSKKKTNTNLEIQQKKRRRRKIVTKKTLLINTFNSKFLNIIDLSSFEFVKKISLVLFRDSTGEDAF